MSYRFLASLVGPSTVIVVMSLTPVAAAGKAQPAPADPSTPSRTPWGDPDLQGIWTNANLTPFERSEEFTGKQVLTEEEAAEFEERTNQRNSVDRPPPPGNPGTYNQFWWDRGTKVVPTRQTSLVVNPPDGRIPPLMPAAQKRAIARAQYRLDHPADSWEDVSLFARCITRSLPGAMTPGFYNHNYQILQTPGYVAILVEMIHDTRIIPLDGRPHLGPTLRQWMGDSRGHWEGETLVVETTNFSPKAIYRGSGEHRGLVERFTRVDADTIHYEFTVDDPTTWTRSWTAAIPMTKDGAPDRIFEYACHEGNYGLYNMLAGARAEEKAGAGAAKSR